MKKPIAKHTWKNALADTVVMMVEDQPLLCLIIGAGTLVAICSLIKWIFQLIF